MIKTTKARPSKAAEKSTLEELINRQVDLVREAIVEGLQRARKEHGDGTKKSLEIHIDLTSMIEDTAVFKRVLN